MKKLKKVLPELPAMYEELTAYQRRIVRKEYEKRQNHRCMFCNNKLEEDPPKEILNKYIDWDLFPKGFLDNPIHLQHDHVSGLTEGAIHSFCNAYLWFYEGR